MADRKRFIDAYVDAMQREDFDALGEMRHPDYVAVWPQSGEVVRGHANWVAIATHYPGDLPSGEITEIHGRAAPHVHVSRHLPMGMPVITLAEGGDRVTVESTAHYPGQGDFFVVTIAHIRDRKVIKEVTYWAEPFDPPDWRAQLVERIGG